MVFSSIEFIWLFMPVVLALYLALPPRWRNVLLAAASIGFYVWGARSVVFLFLGSILLNYVLGRLIGRAKETADAQRVKTVTAVGVALNLAILFFWKYA